MLKIKILFNKYKKNKLMIILSLDLFLNMCACMCMRVRTHTRCFSFFRTIDTNLIMCVIKLTKKSSET